MHEKDHRDYEFIVAEIQRFQKLSRQEQWEYWKAHPWDALGGVKTPAGGVVYFTRDARTRFHQITERGLRAMASAAERHNTEKVYEELPRHLVKLLVEGSEITAKNAHDVFDGAIRNLEAKFVEQTHYVPCAVVMHRVRDVFTIGPVTFILRERFFRENERAIREAAERWNPSISADIFNRTQSFYTDFMWIARITVPPCDASVSHRRAHLGIQKALDVFKLIVGSGRAGNVKMAHDIALPQRPWELTSTPAEGFDIRSSGTSHDAVVNDEWYQQVTAFPEWPLFEGALSEYWSHWGDHNELLARLMDALSWHSDAISERDLGARIIKFWTAIERLLSTSAKCNLAARLAVLSADSADGFEHCAKKYSTLYQRRSEIVHGSAHRTSESWYRQAAAGSEEASKTALLQFLRATLQIRRHYSASDRKSLEGWLVWLDKIAKQYRMELAKKPKDDGATLAETS
ncbi:MAG: hypothetical protein LAP87_17155 [Acidobacteriia bacterium]|nr:hypothetical protein [Terriglobia bacterium]